jgi:hypothetical protein
MRLFLYSRRLVDLPVVPVLLLWGPGTPIMNGGRAIEDEVHVLDGNEFSQWKYHYMAGHRLLGSKDDVKAALADHVRRSDPTYAS